ncbi:hypothetical protein [Nonomuraea sp. NPDC050643]|uniref:hypothetical protein n=1 Tax=Nonomuraea sp. NPDC050643 TaxID=3155660 RepID=UPI0033E8C3A2
MTVRLIPVIDALGGALHDLTEGYPEPPADRALHDDYWQAGWPPPACPPPSRTTRC